MYNPIARSRNGLIVKFVILPVLCFFLLALLVGCGGAEKEATDAQSTPSPIPLTAAPDTETSG